MHRFYSPPAAFGPDSVRLDEGETRHLRDVLRLGIGDAVNVFDGEGREFLCSVVSVSRKSAELRIESETVPTAPESPLELTVAASVTPLDQFDLAVQKSVELGVYRFFPLITSRSEVKESVARKRVGRWRRIAYEASKQCGRARLMAVEEPVSLLELYETADQRIVLFSERSGVGFDRILPAEELTIVFGPKGGWDDDELELATKNDATVVTFGGRILRAETAAIALTAIIQHRFGDIN